MTLGTEHDPAASTDGGMADRVRRFDWAGTPLGPIDRWPAALRIAVDICLGSRFPMFVWWGPHRVNLYNDAYVPILGKRHPLALGEPAERVWHETWGVLGPQADAVLLRGEATWNERVPLVMERHGFAEETWFTWSYSPIRDETGRVAGLFCACTEDTQRVTAERERDALLARSESERSRLVQAFDHAPTLVAVTRGPGHVFEYANARYRATFGDRDLIGRAAADALPELRRDGYFELLDRVYASGKPYVGTNLPAHVARASDGLPTPRYFDFVFQPLLDGRGVVGGVLVHAADVTDHHRAEALDRFLIRLDEATRPLTDPQAITAAYARLLGEFLDVDRCAYADVEPDEDTFNLTGDFTRPGTPSAVGRYRFAQFGDEVLRLMRQDRPFVVDDIDRHEPPPDDFSAYRGMLIRAVICVPLHKAGRFVAAMAVHRQVPRAWLEDEVELVRHVAGRCWESIERARVERTLRDSEERFRAAFEQAAVGIAHVSLDGRWLRVNQKLCQILGYAADELLTLTFQTITFPDDLGRDVASAEKLVAGELDTYSIEKRYVRKDGQVVWANLTVSIVGDETGRYFVSVVEDIADRKAAERRLLDESEVVDTISRVGRSLSAELDTQKLIQTVTDATTDLTGAQFGAFFQNVADPGGQAMWLYTLSGAPREAFSKFPPPRATALFGPTLSGQRIVRVDDVRQHPDFGKNAPFGGMPAGHLPVRSYMAVPVVSRSGGVLGALLFGHARPGVFTERAERIVAGVAAQAAVALDNAMLFDAARKANEAKDTLLASEQAARAQAERASRMKDEFLATLSHELRTPLNAILGWATILKSGPVEPADLSQALDTIERNARSQTQIIEDLLDMSRIISGKIRLSPERLDLAAAIAGAVRTVTPAAEAKRIRIDLATDAGAVPVSGDPARLQQVLWNLLSNAIKFTPAGGRVTVRLDRHGDDARATIIDAGEGIPPEFLPHVFDRFRQADASTTRRHGGLGLGLAIVKQLVELHGGTVLAESAGVGLGATFTVTIPESNVASSADEPAAGGREQAAATARGSVDCGDLDGVRVLVVDDEPDVRSLLRRLLVDCHATVATAASAAEAFEAIRSHRPDVLVSDIGMPLQDGYALIRRVRALGPEAGGRTPAVAVTAYARAEDRALALAAGFDAHLTKPVEPADLVAAVVRMAGRRVTP